MDNVDIYIKIKWTGGFRGDGSAAAVMVFVDRNGKEHKKVETVAIEEGTQERLQLLIILKTLNDLRKSCSVGIYTDSDNIRNAIENRWIDGWVKNKWKSKKGKEIKNKDLWEQVKKMMEKHQIGIMDYISRYEDDLNITLKEKEKEQHGGEKSNE